MSELMIDLGGDPYYDGPIALALAYVRVWTRVVLIPHRSTYRIELRYRDNDLSPKAGHGITPEAALRFALGAFFGPMDEEYDEDELATALELCSSRNGHVPGADHRWQDCPTYREDS